MHAKTLARAIALAAILALAAPNAAGAATTIVHPDQMSGWTIQSSGVTASGSFVLGAPTPPLGQGSYRQRANKTDVQRLRTAAFNGQPLEGMDISFSTYTTDTGITALTTYLEVGVDTSGDGVADETLAFEPYEQQYYGGTATTGNTWQAWDADAGNWWSTATGGPTGTRYSGLSSYLALPGKSGARVAAGGSSVSLTLGSADTSWPSVESYVDAFTVNTTTYDFEAITLIVDCDEATDDIAAVQAAVNGVSNGYTIKLKGTCDFSAAAAHGGDITSVASTAVLIRPGAAINGLTITSAGAPQSASVVGSGTQTAFTVAPGNNNVTITGLRFVNLARPIVAINTANTTIGTDTGQVPSPAANRILGGATMNSAILGIATDRGASGSPGTIAITYGAAGSSSASYAGQSGASLTGFKVVGNYISYNPPGTPSTDGTRDVVGIDVRQRAERLVDGLGIQRNAVGMFASEFPSINMNGIKVHSLTPFSGSTSPAAPTNYFIRNVQINGNNLGRLEEIGGSPGDVHASGRLAIQLLGVSNFDVSGNGVRARLSPTGFPMPGGGIIASDSGFGRINGNGVIVVADPSTLESDMGAIGVVDEIGQAFAGSAKPQKSTTIEIAGNIIGPVTNDAPGLGAQRGIVVNGSSKIVAHDNVVKFASDKALNVAVPIKGPGSASSPAVTEIPKTVTSSVLCRNTLEGAVDAQAETVFGGSGTGNAFPAGGAFAGNTACAPTLDLSTTLVLSGQSLVASGKAWPDRPASVRVTDGASGFISGATTAAGDGSYSVTFTPAQMATLQNGTLTAVTSATDDVVTSFSMSSLPKSIELLLDTTPPAAPVIQVPAQGSWAQEYVTVSGTTEPNAGVQVRRGTSATILGSAAADSAGRWAMKLRFADGPQQISARATDVAGNVGAWSQVRSFEVDAVMPSVRVTAPTALAVFAPGETGQISGVAGDDRTLASVELLFFDTNGRSVAKVIAGCTGCGTGSATWTANVPALPMGYYVVRAYAVDHVENRLYTDSPIVRL